MTATDKRSAPLFPSDLLLSAICTAAGIDVMGADRYGPARAACQRFVDGLVGVWPRRHTFASGGHAVTVSVHDDGTVTRSMDGGPDVEIWVREPEAEPQTEPYCAPAPDPAAEALVDRLVSESRPKSTTKTRLAPTPLTEADEGPDAWIVLDSDREWFAYPSLDEANKLPRASTDRAGKETTK